MSQCNQPLVSVVVPAYNEEELLGRCLLSLQRQTFPRSDYEIIVVDNASTDRTRHIAELHADRVLVEPRKGLLFARQTGFEAARGAIILRTDADAVAPSDWIQRAYTTLGKRQDWIALSGLYYPDCRSLGTFLLSCLRILCTSSVLNLKGSVVWLSGACAAFRRREFEEVGGFNLSCDPCCGDQLEISYRLRQLGKIGFDKKWWVWVSVRRVKDKSLKSLFEDFVCYQLYCTLYFSIFKRNPQRFLGSSWKDVRSRR
jgi:glycosyltransferase involved in cell wall biosynthesis